MRVSIKPIQSSSSEGKYMRMFSLLVKDAGQFFDVLDSVFEGLDLGERLSSPAVHRRQVIPQLMERLRQTAHAQLLPLARLHPPLHAHLHFGLLLLGDAGVFASGRRVRRGSIGARAHLRGRAHGFKGGLRRGRVSRCPFLSPPLPAGQNLRRSDVDVHPAIDLCHILSCLGKNVPLCVTAVFIPTKFKGTQVAKRGG